MTHSAVPYDASRVVVAIDGPAGSGKSTVARRVAERLGLRYLDTGALYRAVTVQVLATRVELADPAAVQQAALSAELEVVTDPVHPRVLLNGEDVTAAVRSLEVTGAVSAVAKLPAVRAGLLDVQRAVLADGGVVVEGRDIGTTVAPDAQVKVFLTATPAARAQRRTAQPGEAAGTLEQVQSSLLARDAIDSQREASPLERAPDAVLIDSTMLTADEVVDEVVALARAAMERV